MKSGVVILILLALVLTSCGPSARVTRLPDLRGEDSSSEVPILLPSEDINQQFAPTPFGQWQAVVYNVSKLASHEFSIDHGITGGVAYKFRGNLGRVIYGKAQNLPDRSVVDTVFFDTKTKRAVGYCKQNERLCEPFAGMRFQLSFDTYHQVTPVDWVLKFANASPIEFTPKAQIIKDHFATKVVFENPRVKTTLFIDEFTKLPVSIEEEAENLKRSYAYDNVKVNTVTAKEVFH